MKKYLFISTAIVFISAMSMMSCKKTDTAPVSVNPDTSAAVAGDHTVAIQTLSDADNSSQNNLNSSGSPATAVAFNVHSLMDGDTKTSAGTNPNVIDSSKIHISLKGHNGDSVYITAQHGKIPGTATMSYGTTGIRTVDGHLRQGQINNHFTGKINQVGFVDTITFSNYYLDGRHVEGMIILTRVNDTTITRQVVNGKVTFANGNATKIAGSTTRIYSVGSSSIKNANGLPQSLKVKEYGVLTGTSQAGVTYSATTPQTKPLVFDFSCSIAGGLFPTSGAITFHSDFYKNDRVIDYGTGSCDQIYTVSIGTYVATVNAGGSATTAQK